SDLAFKWVFLMFVAFILACGTTHLIGLWTLWYPDYWLDGGIKAITAGFSLSTAVLLWVMMPKVLALPGPAQLAFANQELQKQISERIDAEEALREKNIELEKANLAKDHFLASMSHELRTHINAIIGFTGTLLMQLPGPLTPNQEKQLRTVQASAKHLLSLINDLLDLTKIESGKVKLNFEPVVCQSVVQEVISALRPLAESKNLAFEAMTPAQELVILTDRRALSQILLNLANNALKFTEQGGVLLELMQRQTNGQRLIEISLVDSGIGIRQEDQVKLFQAFMQIDSSATRRYEGTGLGLYLSQKLAGLLCGRIEFESVYGQGSRFTLAIPQNST
ncbi:MAG: hypothetical protein HYR94_11550, partial [Chloroflexi bacterium]|nr:hypothetical protein [Chloroflexota bacterium]